MNSILPGPCFCTSHLGMQYCLGMPQKPDGSAQFLVQSAQGASTQAPAPPDVFADSPDCLDDLDLDGLVSAHQQQAARPHALQSAAPAVHAACSIIQPTQHLLRPQAKDQEIINSASLPGPAASSRHATFKAAAARVPAAGAASAAAQHAPAASQYSVPARGAAEPSSSASTPPASQHAGFSAAMCSHGIPMQRCGSKQDHLNEVNARLVKILLGEITATAGETDRLKGEKAAIERALQSEPQAQQAGAGRPSAAPAVACDASACAWPQQQSSFARHAETAYNGEHAKFRVVPLFYL